MMSNVGLPDRQEPEPVEQLDPASHKAAHEADLAQSQGAMPSGDPR